MRKVVIIGGELQGIEVSYLARKAGYHSTLIDMRDDTPASGIADEILICDVCELAGALISSEPDTNLGAAYDMKRCTEFNAEHVTKNEVALQALRSADLIVPATENTYALDAISKLSDRYGLPLAFSYGAYQITSSKIKSDELIHRLGVPAPLYAPGADCSSRDDKKNHPHYGSKDGDSPDEVEQGIRAGGWIVKPSEGSGSHGVRRFASLGDARNFVASAHPKSDLIIQEYIEGPSYSIEVIGKPGNYRTYAITQIHVDEVWDCNLVTAPCDITSEQDAKLRDSALKFADSIRLYGIMDVEAILHDGKMKVLEIDARIPSQTPAVVLAATGVNLLEELMALAAGDFDHAEPSPPLRYASYENIVVTPKGVSSEGEHIMGEAGPLTMREDFCGADASMTDYREGCPEFRGIFINASETEAGLAAKRDGMYEAIERLILRRV